MWLRKCHWTVHYTYFTQPKRRSDKWHGPHLAHYQAFANKDYPKNLASTIQACVFQWTSESAFADPGFSGYRCPTPFPEGHCYNTTIDCRGLIPIITRLHAMSYQIKDFMKTTTNLFCVRTMITLFNIQSNENSKQTWLSYSPIWKTISKTFTRRQNTWQTNW